MLSKFFKAINKCDHAIIDVCIWHVVDGDFGAEAWDGAYTSFCTKCQKFGAEMRWGPRGPDGPFIDRGDFVIEKSLEYSSIEIGRDLTKWIPAEQFRWKWKNAEKIESFRRLCESKGFELKMEFGPRPNMSVKHKSKKWQDGFHVSYRDAVGVDAAISILTRDTINNARVE